MVTSVLAAGSGASRGDTVPALIELAIFVSWIALFGIGLVYAAIITTARATNRRKRRLAGSRAVGRVTGPPPGLDALLRADPAFDEQLLLDAALTATLLVFLATSTGDMAPIGRLATGSFWETPFGVITRMTARDRRRQEAREAKEDAPSRRRLNIPLDYQPSVPELIAVQLGRDQRVRVRVSFGQLQALVAPSAEEHAAGAAAPNFGAFLGSLGKSVATQMSDRSATSVSWLSSGGRYDLTFVRPSGARTAPSAALADRTCTRCGATYRSELAIACAHCQAPRALPWGDWRLAQALPV